MVSESDISRERAWFYEQRARLTVSNLQKRNINAQYVPDRKEALTKMLEMIPEGVTVACGDSISLYQVGIIERLRKRNKNIILHPVEKDDKGAYVVADREQRLKMERDAFFADIFLTGINAITLDGQMVSIDTGGNRVAPMIFGPQKVSIIAGANKIVRDLNEAFERIHSFAAPINSRRHYMKHHWQDYENLPCVRTGRCVDCRHDWRVCCYTVIIEGSRLRNKDRINVILVGEELGI